MTETKAPPPSHPALQIDDARVTLKLELLERAMPARSAAVFGDMYIVEGAYTLRCLELGCERVVLVDSLETPGWQRTRLSTLASISAKATSRAVRSWRRSRSSSTSRSCTTSSSIRRLCSTPST